MLNKSPVSTRQVNGRTIYETIDEATLQWLDLFERLFTNSSYHFANTERTERLARLKGNLSDFTSEFYLPIAGKSFYSVPVPDNVMKVSMLTGHNQPNNVQ